MKNYHTFFFLIILMACRNEEDNTSKTEDVKSTILNQLDSASIVPVDAPMSEYSEHIYSSKLQTDIHTYQYANLWDIDNDEIDDSIAFISNGGAHAYYHLELKLSSEEQWTIYPTFLIDMPYFSKVNFLKNIKPPFSGPQLVVHDFDEDGAEELFLNIDNSMGSIPKNLQAQGVNSSYLLIDYLRGELIVKNYYK